MRSVTLALAALLSASPALAAQIELRTHGGDAWSFDKRLEATTDAACEQVVLHAPAGSVQATPEGATWAALVPLRPGANEVRAECRKDGAVVAASPPQTWTLRLADRPTARVRLAARDGKIVLDAGASAQSPRRAAPLIGFAWTLETPEGETIPLGTGPRLELPLPTAEGEHRITLRVTDAQGGADEGTAAFRIRSGQFVEPAAADAPAWLAEAVAYGVIPGLFGPRGLADVTARLHEIAATGANALWLSPITDSPPDDFGYAVSDYFRVRASMGSAEDLRALVAAAHARGMRVLLDFVPNHMSDQHPYFRDAEQNGAASPYADWFQRDEDGEPASYFNWDNLKNLNYDNAEVRRMMIEAFAHWVRSFDIDGFRVDAAWGVRERAPEFWREWRAELKRIKPDLVLLAEASGRDPWYTANGFDAAYDWGDGLGQWAWKDVFADGRANLDALRAALTSHDGRTPLLRFLNNNDTGRRFADRHGLGMAKAAAAMLFTLPGVPLIYTGDDLAAAFEPYDEGAPLDWNAKAPLRDHYRRLAELRRAHPALRSQGMTPARTDRDDAVLAYRRGELLGLVNFTDQPVTVAVDGGAGTAADLWSGETVSAGQLSLPPFGTRVLSGATARPHSS